MQSDEIKSTEKTWQCQTCKRDVTIKAISVQIKSELHKRRERFAFTVKKFEFDKLEFSRKDIRLKDVITDFKVKFLHTFQYRCDIKITNQTSSVEVFCSTINNKI